MAHDLVIRGGTLVDGTGAPGIRADVAIDGDRVTEIGQVDGTARRTIDAEGKVVTPGFVDIHTHLDAQLGWDPTASSSCWHGVTSVVLGNCGVTFAPVRPADHGYLAAMMESVEDIPASSILAGLPWDWETYGEYLATLDRLPKGVHVGGMVGHCALRWYAMGERSLEQDQAGEDDLALMCHLVDEAITAGALGLSTSRTTLHRVPDGRPVPGTNAPASELLALAEPLGRHGRGVFELAAKLGEGDGPELVRTRAELAWLSDLSRATGRPVTFNLVHVDSRPDLHSRVLSFVDEEVAAGADLRPQTTPRGIGILFSIQHRTPFDGAPAWKELQELDLAGRLAALEDPVRRDRLVADAIAGGPREDFFRGAYVVGPDVARYDFGPNDSLAAVAARAGEQPVETFIRLTRESRGGMVLSYLFLNQQLDAVHEMLRHERIVLGLGDSGAHVGQIMDASLPTFFLSYWVREREAFTLEEGVRRLTSDTARLFGLEGRGVVAPGAFADLNVIDLDALTVAMPRYVHDFPGGAGRYVQGSSGYDCTVVAGQVFMVAGEHTGALAGTMLRSGGAAAP